MELKLDSLILDIPNETPIEIIIEFPMAVLGAYNGISNLDETWDGNIMPIIHDSLFNIGLKINKSELQILPSTRSYDEKLSYIKRALSNESMITLYNDAYYVG